MTKKDCQARITSLLKPDNKYSDHLPPLSVAERGLEFHLVCGSFSAVLPVNSWRDASIFVSGMVKGAHLSNDLRYQECEEAARRRHDEEQEQECNRLLKAVEVQAPTISDILAAASAMIGNLVLVSATVNEQEDIAAAESLLAMFRPIHQACVDYAFWRHQPYSDGYDDHDDYVYDNFVYQFAGVDKRYCGAGMKVTWPEILDHILTTSIPNIVAELEAGNWGTVAARVVTLIDFLEWKLRDWYNIILDPEAM